LVLLALLLAQATGRLELPPLNALDRQIHDARLSLFAPATRDERIVILDIDDRALAQQGRWPWPRRRLAGLIDKAFDEGALLMGMDLIMAEPDDSAGLALIEDLARKDSRLLAQLPTLRARFDDDAVMANALRRHPVVLGFYLSDREGQSAARPPPLMPAPASLPAWPGFGGNLAVLQEAAGQAGFLNALVDADGLVRRSLLVARQGDAAYGSLPLMLAEQLLGTAGTEPLMMNGQLQGLSLHTARGPRLMRTGAFGEVFVPYRGPSGQYATLSAAELLDPRAEPARLRAALAGKVVLLGSSAAGLLDQHSMPLQAAYAGVATHASVLSGLLDGQLYHARNDAPAIAALLLLGIAAILLLALPRMNLLPGTALTAALLAALTGHNLWAWSAWHEAWPLTAPLVLTVSLWSLHLLLMQLQERAARQRLQTLFGQYVPVSRVQAMARAPDREHYTLESRAAELSVMFADVRGFTSIAETLAPADLAALMNAYFSAMTEVIGAHQGTLDKYIGDAVMAFWGAPQDDPLHARHAVLAAQAMLARLTLLNEDFAARGWPRLEIRIGINTGTVIVGDLGSQERRAYTVLGDAVNVAARLQALCTTHGVSLLIGPETARQADMPCTSLGPTTLRGHRRQLLIYAPALTAESGPEPVPQEEDEEPPSACR
jgi:adenylate cyclase